MNVELVATWAELDDEVSAPELVMVELVGLDVEFMTEALGLSRVLEIWLDTLKANEVVDMSVFDDGWEKLVVRPDVDETDTGPVLIGGILDELTDVEELESTTLEEDGDEDTEAAVDARLNRDGSVLKLLDVLVKEGVFRPEVLDKPRVKLLDRLVGDAVSEGMLLDIEVVEVAKLRLLVAGGVF